MIKERRIEIDVAIKRELAEKFKISVRAVYDALNYKTQSGTAKAIRAAALQWGGKVYVPKDVEDIGKKFESLAHRD